MSPRKPEIGTQSVTGKGSWERVPLSWALVGASERSLCLSLVDVRVPGSSQGLGSQKTEGTSWKPGGGMGSVFPGLMFPLASPEARTDHGECQHESVSVSH